MLSSGCNLVVLGVLNQSFYRVGDVKFLCLAIDKDELRKSYRDNGFDIIFWEEYCPPEILETDPEFSDFQTAFIMHAVKIWGSIAISNLILANRRFGVALSTAIFFFSGGSRESQGFNPIFWKYFQNNYENGEQMPKTSMAHGDILFFFCKIYIFNMASICNSSFWWIEIKNKLLLNY